MDSKFNIRLQKDLNERKINLDDDYIKFIRYGQHFIDKNGSGILAYISNNSFIDGITHRQMRKNLLESFDKIYIIDLHGNAKRKKFALMVQPDQNVFDIMQGVSINIFVKTGNKKYNELGQVFHFNLQGKREFKYEILNANSIKSFEWKQLEFTKPNYFFVPKNFDEIKTYEKGFKIDELMYNVSGIETKRDHFAIDFSLENLERDFGWKNSFVSCLTRPFDIRWIIYNGIILSRDRGALMAGMNKNNLGLVLGRQSKEDFAALLTNCVCTHKIVTVYDRSFIFPLYLYPKTKGQQSIGQFTERVPNLNQETVKQIAGMVGLTFTNEKKQQKKRLHL
nr:type ISP restriction/modification enzyme [Candidatus Brachybacter algidus]